MADELLDRVNENDEVIGTVLRSQAHGDPSIIHREIALFILTKNSVLLQERSLNKKVNPGRWSLSVGGHIPTGEAPIEAAKREAKEEMNIIVTPIFYKKKLDKREIESRIIWMYYALVEKEVSVKFNKDEISQVKWVKLNEIDKFRKEVYPKFGEFTYETLTMLKKYLEDEGLVD